MVDIVTGRALPATQVRGSLTLLAVLLGLALLDPRFNPSSALRVSSTVASASSPAVSGRSIGCSGFHPGSPRRAAFPVRVILGLLPFPSPRLGSSAIFPPRDDASPHVIDPLSRTGGSVSRIGAQHLAAACKCYPFPLPEEFVRLLSSSEHDSHVERWGHDRVRSRTLSSIHSAQSAQGLRPVLSFPNLDALSRFVEPNICPLSHGVTSARTPDQSTPPSPGTSLRPPGLLLLARRLVQLFTHSGGVTLTTSPIVTVILVHCASVPEDILVLLRLELCLAAVPLQFDVVHVLSGSPVPLVGVILLINVHPTALPQTPCFSIPFVFDPYSAGVMLQAASDVMLEHLTCSPLEPSARVLVESPLPVHSPPSYLFARGLVPCLPWV